MKFRASIILATTLIMFGLFMRIFPHVPNFSPVLAIALFAGFLFPRKYALLIPLAIMVISDAVIGFHGLSWLIWACYLLIVYGATYLPKNSSFKRVITVTLGASTFFFLVTNFAVWAEGRMYAMTPAGLWECYVSALPFFRNSLVSDVLYSATFFGLYAYAIRHKKLQNINASTA